MKTYKISQTIEKNLYPIEKKLDEIRNSNRKYLRQFLDIYAPSFISVLLTISFGGEILSTPSVKSNDQVQDLASSFFSSLFGKCLCIIGLFIMFAFVSWIVVKVLTFFADRRDSKGNKFKRDIIAEEFYKVQIPEIITGVGLFEKAYEIEKGGEAKDAEEIVLSEDEQAVSNKAILFYYESFYHFRLVASGLEEIIEFKKSDRKNLRELYASIGIDALRNSVHICCHCIQQINNRIDETDEKKLLRQFQDFERALMD